MILINSASYVSSSLRNELGNVPPVFVPFGNQKLLTYQIERLRAFFDEQIVLSLPQSYQLSQMEKKLLSRLQVSVCPVPDELKLGEAILYVLNVIETQDGNVRMLHGDTLLTEFPKYNDVLALGQTIYDYHWEHESNTQGNVWCGYFAFSSIRLLVAQLAKKRCNFVAGVRQYHQHKTLDLFYCTEWFDFGHINTYFRSRAMVTTQRSFNELKIVDGVVKKQSTQNRKIEAEGHWFFRLPEHLKIYIPQLISQHSADKSSYCLEYLNALPLNELFVHGRKIKQFWLHLCALLSKFMQDARGDEFSCQSIEQIQVDTIKLYQDKTINRLDAYAHSSKIDLDAKYKYSGKTVGSIREIANDCIARTLKLPIIPCYLHGDLCFSNILYDSRADNIKVIDPRGINADNELTLLGDQKYDLAKLCHSFVGLYDFIIADAFELIENEEVGVVLDFDCDVSVLALAEVFWQMPFIPNFDNRDILPLTVLLFLSMLPLHSDKPLRQKAMLANAVRLYAMIK